MVLLPFIAHLDAVTECDTADLGQQIPVVKTWSTDAFLPAVKGDFHPIWKDRGQRTGSVPHARLVSTGLIGEVDLDDGLPYQVPAECNERSGLVVLVGSKEWVYQDDATRRVKQQPECIDELHGFARQQPASLDTPQVVSFVDIRPVEDVRLLLCLSGDYGVKRLTPMLDLGVFDPRPLRVELSVGARREYTLIELSEPLDYALSFDIAAFQPFDYRPLPPVGIPGEEAPLPWPKGISKESGTVPRR